MKKLLLKSIFMIVPIFIGIQSYAQVGGISYTLSPFVEYNKFSDKSGIGDGFLGGAQLGLGFGQNVELRATYSKGFSLQTDLENFPFEYTDEQLTAFSPKNVELKRYGGEVKFNLSRGALLPYITLGTGVQSIGLDTMETSKQIYLNAGLGIKLSVGDRYTLGLQAMNTSYKYSSVNGLLNDEDRAEYSLAREDYLAETMSNWSLRASLVLYIGGRKPGVATDVDQAYWDNFSGGFGGLSIPLEIQYSKMNFNENLAYRDTRMAGTSAGFNFGPLVGVRGFYWRALEEGAYTKFDELSMYGGEARFKLNEGKGFTPWLTIGGGNIHTGDNYVGVTDTIGNDNKGFAMGGLGIDLPFSKYLNLTGFVKSIVTSSNDLENLSAPEELNYSWNYGVSVNFILGKNKKKIDVVKQSVLDDYILASDAENIEATEKLKNEYEDKIKGLEAQIQQAITEQDLEEVKNLSEQKDKAEQVVDELKKSAYANSMALPTNQQPPIGGNMNHGGNRPMANGIYMSPSEFQLLLRDLMDAPKNNPYANPVAVAPSTGKGNTQDIQSAIADYNKDQQIAVLKENMSDIKQTLNAMNAMNEKLDDNNKDMMTNMERMLNVFSDRFNVLEKKIEKTSTDLELMKERHSSIEKAMSNQDGSAIQMESFESKQIQKDIEYTNQRIEDLKDLMVESIRKLEAQQSAPSKEIIREVYIEDYDNDTQSPKVSNTTKVKTVDNIGNETGFFSKFKYKGMSGFTGFNVGGPTTFNLGYRLHYQVGSDSSRVEFMPESFFGLGSPSSFGISANVLYSLDFITKSKFVNPYIGAGLGMLKVGDSQDADKLTGSYNLIIGTSLNVWSGDVYVDYTSRNLSKYNQLTVGYRFPF